MDFFDENSAPAILGILGKCAFRLNWISEKVRKTKRVTDLKFVLMERAVNFT